MNKEANEHSVPVDSTLSAKVAGFLQKIIKRLMTLDRAYFRDVFPAVLMVRLSRFEFVRNAYTLFFCQRAKLNLNALATSSLIDSNLLTSSETIRSISDALRKRSHFIGLNLNAHAVQDILQYSENNLCFGNNQCDKVFFYKDKHKAFEVEGSPFIIATYFNASNRCGSINALSSDPLILQIVKNFLGDRGKYIGCQLVWSFPAKAGKSEQNAFSQLFHIDTDDWRFLKFFWYLTEVDELSGPHVVIAGSHQGKLFRHQLAAGRYTDDVIHNAYGRNNEVVIVGPAGTGFVEDTTAYHKGQHPVSRDRLMLVLEFAVNDWGTYSDVQPGEKLRRFV